ncbi:MAG: peptidoglycan DD-metalloendopeptidase family protein [Prevotella sp.]|nr:peptidoglycan DD-metalloendopeptidase family protein [Prevotella sp.]MDE6012437.1 peptidoglycan DD-metalloendopeptidase family protein [Prevotella sp.]MDE6689744.1 peptidoglycan DD-metalloendopeptidase family protein [Prevotella sp.]MDE6808226.1 peptidoglycan DD-metalloendopeptidase family protein [Prevotella sp.]
MIFKQLKKLTLFAFASLATLPMAGQDLLANQAPIDRKMKAVDSIMMQQLIMNEIWEAPAVDLYEEWSNDYTHVPANLPDSFRIDLRGFCMPTTNRVVTSNFGARWRRQHKGLDIKVYIGDTIRAAFNGKVRIVRYEARGYGKYVVIRHPNGLETYYGHMSKQLVTENQEVRAGDPIGLGGNTGRSTGSHLHFETRLAGVALNPAIMFDFKNQDVIGDEWTFRRSTYNNESSQATRLRGTGGVYRGGDGLNYAELPNTNKNQSNDNVRYHKVKRGETLSSIARKHRTSVSALCSLNHIGKNVTLKPNQILKYK